MYPFCCAFSYVSSGHLVKMIHDYTDCIWLIFIMCFHTYVWRKKSRGRKGLQLEVWPLISPYLIFGCKVTGQDNIVRRNKWLSANMSSTNMALKVLCISCIRFGTVPSHKPLQLRRLFERVVALLTDKGFLSGVWKHVILQTIWMTRWVAALVTCKRLFSSMFENVLLEILSFIARIVALLTPERPLSWMC